MKCEKCDESRAYARRCQVALRDLVMQFDTYRGGWLGEGIWRDRVGLPDDLTAARVLLAQGLPGDGDPAARNEASPLTVSMQDCPMGPRCSSEKCRAEGCQIAPNQGGI